MSIKINIPSHLRTSTNNTEAVEVNGSNVGECLNHLVKQFPGIEKALFNKEGKLLNFIDIYVNKESAFPEELTKPVSPGDELHIVVAIGGG